MKISTEVIGRLKAVDWFNRCGIAEHIETNLNAEQVASWSEAFSYLSDATWEDVGSEAQGMLTEHLSSRFPQLYQDQWNKIVKEARNLVNDVVMPSTQRFQSEHRLADTFRECVEWDLLHAVMTLVYADCSPPDFFLDLLKIYESGHFPCGWRGDWPSGGVQFW